MCILGTAAVGVIYGAAAIEVVGDANAHTITLSNRTVVVATASGKIYVTEAGVIELLAVGGGGGGGEGYTHTNDKYYYGGGGGAGGVVHIESLEVAPGEYDVVIGVGGAVGSNGGNTTVFGQTAFGGGRGAKGMGLYVATSGASGGGGARSYYNDGRSGSNGAAAKAEYLAAPYLNLGNNGANAPNTACMSGGGGGAGGAASGANPGVAYLCSITGEEVAYAGGGGGYNNGYKTTAGGGSGSYGGGGNSNSAGGGGVVIVAFARKPGRNETAFDDATGGVVTSFRTGGTGYRVHTFAESGTFVIPHCGWVDVLAVGGGGGGGENYTKNDSNAHDGSHTFRGAGGGAGGVVYRTGLFLTNGVYEIMVGAGGPVNDGTAATRVRGGDTTVFGLTAFGGGCGAKGYALAAALSGASGGGGSQSYWQGGGTKCSGADAVYASAPYFNLGNKGGDARDDAGTSGGGGGAGGAASGVNPGAAYLCSITGAEVAYAGGGGGYYWGVKTTAGGGSGSYGGGGNSNSAGGGGVVIVRYQMPDKGFMILFR